MARRRPDPDPDSPPAPKDPTRKKSSVKPRVPVPEAKLARPAPSARGKSRTPKSLSSSPANLPSVCPPEPPRRGGSPEFLTEKSDAPDGPGVASTHALEARPPEPEQSSSGSPGPPRSACLPRMVFLILLVLGGAMTALEVRNVLRHPSVLFRSGPKDAPRLVFYQKGHASAREAFLLDEPSGPEGPPRLIQRIDCRPQFSEIGEIRWTADGKAVYAAGRTPQSRGVPVIRWLYEFASNRKPLRDSPDQSTDSGKPATVSATPPEGRLYISRPDFALPGRTAFVEDPAALTARWRLHQGAGPSAAAWYELGAQGAHLFSWQTTRWEKALGD